MKNSSFIIAAIVAVSLSSCYVGVDRGHRHHRTRVEIRAENSNPKDSTLAPASTSINKKDSLQSPATPEPGKQ